MTCLEAQSKIIAYIEYNLDKEQKKEFLKHIQCCEDCKEELNIYYTMIEGMKQLDSNMLLSQDFAQELDQRIQHEMNQNRKKRDLFRSSVVLAIVGVFTFLIIGYVNFLNILYADEQAKIKEMRGEYYFSRTFKERLFEPVNHEYKLNVNSDEEKEMTFYEKVRQYNMLNR